MTDNGRAALFVSASMAMFAVEDACLKVLTRTMPVWQLLAMVGVVAGAVFWMRLARREGVFGQVT
ncbi:hypothetical protein FLP41_11040 [Paracoccus marcusii]|uniref:hypothetical protein n=1 Tax=Paracoccus marcusii TaxID=59779 RepID=UPI002ED267D7|nr:hypothetical protein FLP41_11040 [Paracoccus marcusii]